MCRLVLAVILLALCATLAAQPRQDDTAPGMPAVYLLTYGPGPVYWQRFGHNALRVVHPERGIDTEFNFGYFDFEQENFLLRFIRGRMEYFVATLDPVSQARAYRQENRSIRQQQLNLSPVETERLVNHLLLQLQPGNRTYRYDYYFNNCSTKVRDMIDAGLDGELRALSEGRPTGLSFRDETRRLTVMDPWYYLGLQTGLGQPVNRDMNLWQAYFLPVWLADAVAGLKRRDGSPLVISDEVVFEGGFQPPAEMQARPWRYLAWGLVPAALLLLFGVLLSRPVVVMSLWLGLCGVMGLALAGLWFLTDHEAADRNASLLLFNPLFLPALILMAPAVSRQWGRISLAVMAGGGVVVSALNLWLQLWIPSGPEVLMFVLPGHGVSLWLLLRWLNRRKMIT